MGGYGSGTWHRWNAKPREREFLRLDVNSLCRRGKKEHQRSGILTWRSDGEPIGSITYWIYSDRVRLRYLNGPDRELLDYEVLILKTSCNYGGYRSWFECPSCGRRVGALYSGRRFLCRHCQGFSYTSQNENRGQRAMRRWHKITDRYDFDGDIKPKGMHWKTFDRVCDKLDQADDEATFHMSLDVLKLAAKLGMSLPLD